MNIEADVAGQADHRVDRADRRGGSDPGAAGVSRVLGVEQREAELDTANAETARIGVDLVAGDHAVVVVVAAVRTDADKARKIGAAQAEHLGGHLAAVGQRHILQTALHRQRALDLEEITHTDLKVAAGANPLALAARRVHRDRFAGAGDD